MYIDQRKRQICPIEQADIQKHGTWNGVRLHKDTIRTTNPKPICPYLGNSKEQGKKKTGNPSGIY